MRLLIGVDWSQEHHNVRIQNEAGALVVCFQMGHSPDGLAKLEGEIAKLGVPPANCLIALETAHNLLIDFFWSRYNKFNEIMKVLKATNNLSLSEHEMRIILERMLDKQSDNSYQNYWTGIPKIDNQLNQSYYFQYPQNLDDILKHLQDGRNMVGGPPSDPPQPPMPPLSLMR